MDKESIGVGIILALIAQSLYDVLFYLLLGKIYEEYVAALSVTIAIAFLMLIMYWFGYLPRKKRTTEQLKR